MKTIDTIEIANEIFENLVDCSDNDCPIYDFGFGQHKTLVVNTADGTWQLAGDGDLYRDDNDVDIDLDAALEIANDNIDNFVGCLANQLDIAISNL